MLRLSSARKRAVRESATAYLFLLPGLTLLFLFGLFPIGFALFVSLHQWRRFPGDFVGLDQYVRALGDFAYVAFFWLAIGLVVYGLWIAWQMVRRYRGDPLSFLFVVPGVMGGIALLLGLNWFVVALPVVLEVPQRLRGVQQSTGLFLGELWASFQQPEVAQAGSWFFAMLVAALLVGILFAWRFRTQYGTSVAQRTAALTTVIGFGLLTLRLTLTDMAEAVAVAREAGTSLPIWTQIILISAGVGLLALAYILWRRAPSRERSWAFVLQMGAAAMLLTAGYVLIAMLPVALANADDDLLQALYVTILYTIWTVPIQLFFGLLLAYLLFQKIRFKSMFRVMYFLPYVTPIVATSVVFGVLFSHRPTSPVNELMKALGLPAQKWLLEPTGIFQLIFGPGVPDALAGPSLALFVIILYTSWTYIGYATVVFLAGLGGVAPELYEAARIDGASEWNVFRRITLPLLSPTTFFLTLITVIGTLQSFTQVYILRTPAASNSVDTVGVLIYETINLVEPNMGYASALSLVLFVAILIFTLFQNRLARNRVFYG